MARIKKILENNLVGGNSNTEVYPVTSTRAIYNQEGIQLDEILNNLENSNKKEQEFYILLFLYLSHLKLAQS